MRASALDTALSLSFSLRPHCSQSRDHVASGWWVRMWSAGWMEGELTLMTASRLARIAGFVPDSAGARTAALLIDLGQQTGFSDLARGGDVSEARPEESRKAYAGLVTTHYHAALHHSRRHAEAIVWDQSKF
jgi:hypothetical protein